MERPESALSLGMHFFFWPPGIDDQRHQRYQGKDKSQKPFHRDCFGLNKDIGGGLDIRHEILAIVYRVNTYFGKLAVLFGKRIIII